MTTVRKTIQLMDQIADALAQRRDVQVLATGEGTIGPRIIGVQLRRIWNKKIWNASVFSPHERELWHYYGQAFLVEEADVGRDGALNPKQELLTKAMVQIGTLVILARTIGDVPFALGIVPENIEDYYRRAEK